LSVGKKIAVIVFGVALLVYYKKSIHLYSRRWIFIALIVYLTTSFLIFFIYYRPTILRIISGVCVILVFLVFIFYWFYYRKKYPEEFGLKS
jgi:Ca2+/Na+ antiporter